MMELVADAKVIDFRKLRFLIVDDDPDQRYLVGRTLTGMGSARVTEATSGKHALAVLDRLGSAVDVIIADLQMPGMDGMELIRRIGERKLPVSVILISALDGVLLDSAATMAQAYGVKVIGTIEKPATQASFVAVLEHFRHPAPAAKVETDAIFAPTTNEVLTGLSAGQFEPYFQGVVELASGNVVGAEALARWQHPTRGVLGPETFLPSLTSAGYLDELSWIMLSLSAMEGGVWRRADLRLTVSVNVSATSLADPNYAEAVTQIVTGHGIEPEAMILELTETEAILNVAPALENLTWLRMKGFGLAIDDYGVSYSSMQILTRVPFTEVKIDRSFVTKATTDSKYRAMIEHTVRVANQMGLKTVAEGVETSAEYDLLASLGCDRVQGYLVARPMDGSGFLRWMRDRRASQSNLRPPEIERYGT